MQYTAVHPDTMVSKNPICIIINERIVYHMDVNKIIALSQAGFSAEEITKIIFATESGAGTPAPTKAPDPEPAPAPEPTPEPKEEPKPDPKSEPKEEPNAPPKWFADFMTQYNKDFSDLNRRIVNGNVRTAEPNTPAPKSVDELIAEAYAAIK